MLTQARVLQLLRYEPATGQLFWISRKGVAAGSEAGHVNHHGYVVVRIDGKNYQAHRVIWLYCTGELPPDMIDHIDMNKANNRIENLRLASRSENARNRTRQRNNVSGYKGVAWDAERQQWMATIKVNQKGHYLGRFDDPIEAHEAYKAALCLHGDFARAA